MQAAEIFAQRGVDEIILLDIDATPSGRGPDLKQIEKVAAKFFTPLTVGGGVRSVDDVRDLLLAGADKVAICSGWRLIQEAAWKFGRQAIVGAVDYRGWSYSTHCGKVTRVESSPFQHAAHLAEMGAGEILLTSIDREGMMHGYDLDGVRDIAAAVDVPLIAHGGCGTYAHMREALDAGASAVAAGAMFQFSDATPRGAAKYLAKQGMEVRL